MNLKLTYRPEIDGLRAIAVISVILYHAKIYISDVPIISNLFPYNIFSGGFIGVDIFFVISGYLISLIILKEIYKTGKFSFSFFYERRIRRILPILLLVIFLSILLGWFILTPYDLIDLAKSSITSIGFGSNFYFYLTGLEYWAEESIPSALLHTWSLSVEEQYYILFPVLLLFVFKYFKKYLLHSLIFLFIISLGFAEFGSRNYPDATFYLIHSRFWELICGSLLAYYEIQKGHRNQNEFLNKVMPALGIILIFYAIFFYHDKMNHPSIITIVPVLGVTLIIWFADKNDYITNILSTKIFVGVGLISYSLYLWHYPIFNFIRAGDFIRGEFLYKIYLAIFIFLISILSYFFIEKPSRDRSVQYKKIIKNIIFFIILILTLSIIIIKNNGFKKRFSFEDIETSNPNFTLDHRKYYDEMEKFQLDYDYNNFKNNKKNILIIGNSHGEDIFKIFTFTKYTKNFYFYIASEINRKPEFNYQLGSFLNDLDKIKSDKDNDKDKFLDHLQKQYELSDYIIIATNFDSSSIDKEMKDIPEINNIIKQDNKKLILFDQAMRIKSYMSNRFNRFDYFVLKNKRFPNNNEKNELEKKLFKDSNSIEFLNYHIHKIANENSIRLIKRKEIFCDVVKQKCPILTDQNDKIYWDRTHITKEGAKYFSKKFNEINFFND